MRYCLFFFLIFFCTQRSQAQISLENKGLLQKAESLILSDTRQAKKIGVLLSDNSTNSQEKAFSFLLLAQINLFENNYKEFDTNIISGAQQIEKGGKSNLLIAKLNLLYANEYSDFGLYSLSEKHLHMAKFFIAKINQLDEKTTTELFLKNIEITNQIDNLLVKNLNNEDLSSVQNLKSNNYLSEIYLGLIYYNQTRFYFKRKDKDGLKKSLDQLEILSRKLPALKNYYNNALSLGYILDSDYKASLGALNKTLPNENIHPTGLRNDIYKGFFTSYFALGNYTEAKLYDEKNKMLMDSISYLKNKASSQLIENMPLRRDVVSSKKIENYNLVISIMVAILLLIILIGSIVLFNLKRNFKKYQSLTQKIEQNPLYKSVSAKISDNKEINLEDEAIMPELQSEEQQDVDSKNSILSDKTEQVILKKLEKFEQSHKFVNPNLNLQGLSKLLGTNTKYLSLVINKHKSLSFNQYINELRINYIISKLKNEPKYRKYKISYLAEESGFSSPSTFTTIFKNSIGLSPSIFITYINKENNE